MTGILGGTFDPPHKGHVALAKAALEQLPIDELTVLVIEHPGHRGVVADPQTRLRLAQAAFPGMSVRLDPNAFTVDAVRAGGFGEDALFIVGADQAAGFGTWREPEEVLKWVKLAVGTRAGYPLPDLSRFADRVVVVRARVAGRLVERDPQADRGRRADRRSRPAGRGEADPGARALRPLARRYLRTRVTQYGTSGPGGVVNRALTA